MSKVLKILGVNNGVTSFGKPLKDGGAALLFEDGTMVAVAEERVTRRKHAGGFDNALKYLAEHTGHDPSQADLVAVSTCCEPIDHAVSGHALDGRGNLMAIGHHESHAALAYHASGLETALVVVADGGGNTIGAGPSPERWWEVGREQVSIFVANAGNLEMIAQEFERPFDAGFAEVYRAFTYFLGWHSYIHASRTMALAGLAADRQMSRWASPFALDGDRLSSAIANDPLRPVEMVQRLAETLDLDLGDARTPGAPIEPHHIQAAAYVQHATEDAFIGLVRRWINEIGISDVCLGGGLGLNCVLNARLAEVGRCRVFVPPAPGDDGQALGNVIAARFRLGRPVVRGRYTTADAYLGPAHRVCSATIAGPLAQLDESFVVVDGGDVVGHIVAELLAGSPVCLYEGRSEYGPRALGHRSILADPRSDATARILNRVKDRPPFMPFGPSVRQADTTRLFGADVDSPFMSIAPQLHDQGAVELAAVSHADGTSRVHTVAGDDGSVLARAITRFAAASGCPAVLNTSFNRGGEPIVETPDDALACFAALEDVPTLVIGRFIVLRRSAWERHLDFEAIPRHVHGVTVQPSSEPELRRATGRVTVARTQMPLLEPYVSLLASGRKRTTVRFRPGAIEVPVAPSLPVISNEDHTRRDIGNLVGQVFVRSLTYVRFGELTEADAVADGFADLAEFRKALGRIYPALRDWDWVTVFGIDYQAGPTAPPRSGASP